MLTISMILAVFGVGLLAGAAGVGGVLLIPALTFLAGVNIHEAMASSLFSFFFAGIVATWTFQRYGSIDWKITIPVCAGSFVTSYLGAMVNAYTSPFTLNLTLGIVVVLSSVYSWKSAPVSDLAGRLVGQGRLCLLIGIGMFVGFFCGLTGIGGGLIAIPLMLTLGFKPLASIATGQVMQSIVAVSGSVSNLQNGFVVFPLVWWVIAILLVGVAIGVVVAHKVPLSKLKIFISFLCFSFGVYSIIKAFL